ncbi:hypothetical protein ABW09_17975 [Pluralibacter gergoviae]|nr:hypothetical protein ABW09_17975 [Pluralibacter gergoviae]
MVHCDDRGNLTLASGPLGRSMVMTWHSQYDMAGQVTHRRCVDDVRQRLVSERRYQWDRADQIVRQMFTDGTPDAPEEKYRQAQWGYDAAGRMTQSLQPESGERFWWDAADNRTTPDLHPVWNNMLRRLDGVEREYDGFGRMTVRRDRHRSVTQRFSYDDEHRISEVQIEGDRDYARAEYRYDALGRRTEKVVWRHGARASERTTYAWSGMQMVGERSDRRPDAAVQYVYEENSYAPLARVDSTGDVAEIYWYHAELNGLPERMTDADGETVWRGAFSAWGRTLRESACGGWRGQQNLRFQGQYLDRETGLHYNTLRYYDAWGGCYTQVDPIGLAGGLNTYGYVVDPLVWVDPLGLIPWEKGEFNAWFNNASIQDITDNKSAVESALRSPGGMHEKFPVSLASKAKELGFSAEELKATTVPTSDITFVNVTDRLGNPVPDGPHHGSKAGRHFHNKLIADLTNAENKLHAIDIIETHHSAHMRLKGCI